jgi:S-DNA-T family DNA segregation ATPase FtsK/SpoIIIE
MAPSSFNRPPRIRPRWPAEQIELPEPPLAPQDADRADLLTLLLPLIGAAVLAGGVAVTSGNWVMVLPMGMLALVSVFGGIRRERRQARRAAQEYAERVALFEDRLGESRSQLQRLHELERNGRNYIHPAPSELADVIGGRGVVHPGPRLWERRPDDDDFLDLRVGSGNLPAASQARVPSPAPDGPVDRRLYQLADEFAWLRQVPISVPLGRIGSAGLAGSRAATLGLARALIWQAAILHAPADLRIALVCESEALPGWDWLRWLPHSMPLSNDNAFSRRMCAGDPAAIERLLSTLLEQVGRRREAGDTANTSAEHAPTVLLVVDGAVLAQTYPALATLVREGPGCRVVTLQIVSNWIQIPEAHRALIDVQGYRARWTQAGEPWPEESFSPDLVDLSASDRLARRLASVRLNDSAGAQALPRSARLVDLLGIAALADFEPPPLWMQAPVDAWHTQVPIGVGEAGKPLCLDLNESAHGPHGVIAGTTGAGKSILLQTIIAGLVLSHAPDRLQLLLIDFKGGATLAVFAGMAHTAGMVTDLEGRLADRAIIAIKSELRRRKRLLKETADDCGVRIENIREYREVAQRYRLDPLPNLLIIVDEFDEMARSYADFIGELVRVVKQGRSLGVHLLIATQQPSRAVNDEIRSQLKYFVTLRLGSTDDSREMLLRPDAAFLPTNLPGRAYFRVGSDVRLFQVAQTRSEFALPQESQGPRVSFIDIDGERPIRVVTEPAASLGSDLDVLVAAVQRAGAVWSGYRPPRIWQTPLPVRLSLAGVARQAAVIAPAAAAQAPGDIELPDHAPCTVAGSVDGRLDRWNEDPASHWLQAVIGRIDIPQESRQEPFTLDLSEGHVVVLGAPGSGKTTMLRTLGLSLALGHSPRDLWLYLIDAGGVGLSVLAGLPHCAAWIQARERERVQRLIFVLESIVQERQELFRSAGTADLASYRRIGAGRLPAIVVLIDKLAVVREELRDVSGDTAVIDDLVRIARVGRPFGITLVLSADRATDLGYRLLGLADTRIALRLSEIHEYSDFIGARVTQPISVHLPGRALWNHPDHGPLDLQVALPILTNCGSEDLPDESTVGDVEIVQDLRATVTHMAQAWQAHPEHCHYRPRPVELLAEQVVLADLEGDPPGEAGLVAAIGRESRRLAPAWLVLDEATPHAFVVGGRRSGKTTVLATLIASLCRHYPTDQLELCVLDGPRSGLRGVQQFPQVTTYCRGSAETERFLAVLRTAPASGIRRVVLIDDYSLYRDQRRDQFAPIYEQEPNLFRLLCDLVQVGLQPGTSLVLATNSAFPDDELLRALDGLRCGLILWPGRYDPGTRLLGVTLPLTDQRSVDQPPGRALLVREEERQVVQVALSGAVVLP